MPINFYKTFNRKAVALVFILLIGAVITYLFFSSSASIDSTAEIHSSARIGKGTVVDAGVVIEQNAVIGKNTLIEVGALIGESSVIGDNAVIGKRVVIGSTAKIGGRVSIPDNCIIPAGTIVSFQRLTQDLAAFCSEQQTYTDTYAARREQDVQLPRTEMIKEKAPRGGAAYPYTNGLLLNISKIPELNNQKEVFASVFSQLEDEVTVYPTENYFYFRFETDFNYIWGNIRLSPPERDKGFVNFGYFEYNENPQHIDDFYTRYKQFGPADSISLLKEDNFTYRLSYQGKSVLFHLNNLSQDPPLYPLGQNEVWVQNTHDESGISFRLIYNTNTTSFMWVLNEEEENPFIDWVNISNNILLDPRTEFVYYVDHKYSNRKILIGVEIMNIKQNNYYDGPFDQLADNYITPTSLLSEYIQEAYPYSKGYLDEYGKFKHAEGSRVAITPYHAYTSADEFPELVEWCIKNRNGGWFYACIAYDAKRHY